MREIAIHTMRVPVTFKTRCTTYIGPDGETKDVWTATAKIYGQPFDYLYENEGTSTEAGAVRKLQQRIRDRAAGRDW